MSRVAKSPVTLPSNVKLTVSDNDVTIEGPGGKLTQHCNPLVNIESGEDNVITFKPAKTDPKAWAHAGTARALIANMVKGVTEGFTKTLELVGVGYRAQVSGKKITLTLGFSHPVVYALPEGVTAEVTGNTTLALKSIDKQLLGQVASEIRGYRPPEPYKGKGVRYAGEQIVRKEAKKK